MSASIWPITFGAIGLCGAGIAGRVVISATVADTQTAHATATLRGAFIVMNDRRLGPQRRGSAAIIRGEYSSVAQAAPQEEMRFMFRLGSRSSQFMSVGALRTSHL